MKVLGLDVSTKSTGWFMTKHRCGVITPPAELCLSDKLAWFRVVLEGVVLRYSPDVMVIEDAYYQPRKGSIHTLKSLSQFAGVAAEVAGTNKVKVEFITATQARKYCCGKHEGPFKKPEVFEYFVEKYGLDDWTFEKHNDITDAMALSWAYREKAKLDKKKKKTGGK
jgi:Holliday junction resolvasome RuvABC endonuclease subunit